MRPAEFTLSLAPRDRFDLIDVNARIAAAEPDFLQAYERVAYCSHHTTAGYLEQPLCTRLGHDPASLRAYVQTFQRLFPAGGPYRHDELHLRTELSEAERRVEPRNADSHLTFIGSGLESCVTYLHPRNQPVYFIDLDGVNGPLHRRRTTTVVGYNAHTVVGQLSLAVPVSSHPIDSINLRDERFGLFAALREAVARFELTRGRIDLALEPTERHAGLTTNEYETLLMRHDLVEVLRNPLRFMAEKGRNMLRDPRAIPGKALNYAKYDLVQVINECMEVLGLSESLVERVIDKFFSVAAARRLRMKRSLSLLVSDGPDGPGRIVQGRYQSPILVQWKRPAEGARRLTATFVQFR